MVVTKRLLPFLLLFCISCGVEMSYDTPGAFGRCEPTAAQISDFDTNVFTAEITTQCAGCHQVGTASTNGYKFSSSVTTDAEKKDNYCYHYRFRKRIIEFPLSDGHNPSRNAIFVTPNMIPALIAWVNALHSGN